MKVIKIKKMLTPGSSKSMRESVVVSMWDIALFFKEFDPSAFAVAEHSQRYLLMQASQLHYQDTPERSIQAYSGTRNSCVPLVVMNKIEIFGGWICAPAPHSLCAKRCPLPCTDIF